MTTSISSEALWNYMKDRYMENESWKKVGAKGKHKIINPQK